MSETKTCPFCGEQIKAVAIKCRFCGERLDEKPGSVQIAPGTRIGNFTLGEILGVGGMGTVFRATHQRLGQTVAIKVLAPHLSEDHDRIRRFEQEAQLQANLAHPNIVSVHDFIVQGQMCAFVMDFVEGQDFHDVIQGASGGLPLSRCIELFFPVLDAIDFAHKHKIIHRDIKPSNVMLANVSGTEIVKVTDFGIAKALDQTRHTATGTAMGTLAYMSPEQCQSAGEIDHRADIYSLGVMLFEMVTGRLPFEFTVVFEILDAHLNQSPPKPSQFVPEIPESVEAAILKALAKDPNDRHQSAAEMKVALAQRADSPQPAPQTQVQAELRPEIPATSLAQPRPTQKADAEIPATPPKTHEIREVTEKSAPTEEIQRKSSAKMRLLLLGGVGAAAVVVTIVLMLGFINPAEQHEHSRVLNTEPDPDNPGYWLSKLESPEHRSEALSNIKRLFLKELDAARGEPEHGPVRDFERGVGGELAGAYFAPFMEQGGVEDLESRTKITEILSMMKLAEAHTVYQHGLRNVSEKKMERAVIAAKALKSFCQGSNPEYPFIPPPEKRNEQWHELCPATERCEDELLFALEAVKTMRSKRGVNAANTPDENSLALSAVNALGNIVLANPEHPRRGEILHNLIETLETSDTSQDLSVNIRALEMLGQIGDEHAIPVLIRMLFVPRRHAHFQEIARTSIFGVRNREAMAEALVGAGRMMDAELNAMQQADRFFDVRTIKEQVAITLGQMGLRSEPVVGYLIEELEHSEIDDFDRNIPRGEIAITPEASKLLRRTYAARALGKLGFEPALPIMIERMRTRLGHRGMRMRLILLDTSVDWLEIPEYIDALGSFLRPAETDEVLREFVSWGVDRPLDRAGRVMSLQSGYQAAEILESRAQYIPGSHSLTESMRRVKANYLDRYIPAMRLGETCNDVHCWSSKLRDENPFLRQRAAMQLVVLAQHNEGAQEHARNALFATLDDERDIEVLEAFSFALHRLTQDGCDGESLVRLETLIETLWGQEEHHDRRRLLSSLRARLDR